MSYISKINLNNVQYDIKDAAAQSALSVLNGDSTVVGSVAYAAYWTESDADKKLAADIASLTGGAGSIAQQIQAALDELDSTSSGSGSVVTAVTQTDGQVAVTMGDPDAAYVTISGVNGLTATNVKAAIEEILSNETNNLAEAKQYTNTEIGKLDSSVAATSGYVLTGATITDGKLTDKTEVALTAANVAFVPAANSSLVGKNNVAEALEAAATSSGNALDQAKAYTTSEIAKLDYTDTAVDGQWVTEVDEVDGKITVQRSGINSSQISRTATSYVDGATVEAALQDLGQKVSDNDVTLSVAGTPTTNMLKTYVLSKGNGTEIGKIDIPKDLVVESGSVITATAADTGCTVGEKYIKLVIANQDAPLYIAVKDLVDIYTAQQNAAEVQLAISGSNEISASIVEVGGNKVKLSSTYAEAASATAPAIGDNLDTAVGKLQKEITTNAGTVTSEISRVEGLVEDEETRAKGVEDGLDTRVSAIETTSVVLTASVDTASETLSLTTGTIKTT